MSNPLSFLANTITNVIGGGVSGGDDNGASSKSPPIVTPEKNDEKLVRVTSKYERIKHYRVLNSINHNALYEVFVFLQTLPDPLCLVRISEIAYIDQ